ncbi:MAG: CBS domain-containing protein [Rhodocyclaceae bacterium]
MISIRTVLRDKTRKKPLISMNGEASAQEAVEAMAANDVGAVLVTDDAGKIAGIFTERDCLRKITHPGLDPKTTPLRQVMTDRVRYAKPEYTVGQCLALMTERFFRHLPVLDDEQHVLGIVSIGDLVKAKVAEQEFIIQQMEHYITDSQPLPR